MSATWNVDATYGCFIWTGAKDKRDGRPLVWRGRTPVQAHLVVYREKVGEVPDGMELDHQCRRILCVAPHHMEVVTRGENEKRKSLKYRLKRTHCAKGHMLNGDNRLLTHEGGVLCRECRKGWV